jgi:hypothetical protein
MARGRWGVGVLRRARACWALVALVCASSLTGCGDSPEPTPSPSPSDVAPVDPHVDGLPAVAPDPVIGDEARCDACHGAGPTPAWAFDPQAIESIAYERWAYGYSGGWSKRMLLRADGDAELELESSGPDAPEGEQGVRHGTAWLDPARRSELVAEAAASGLFRFEGDALTSVATHVEGAMITVRRRDRAGCSVFSLDISGDSDHGSVRALAERLELLRDELAWDMQPK